MINILKKTPKTPTLGEQYGAALALHASAASVVDNLIDDHVKAEAELSAIALECQVKIDDAETAYSAKRERLIADHQSELDILKANHALEVGDLADLADAAYGDAYAAYDRAEKLRSLVA